MLLPLLSLLAPPQAQPTGPGYTPYNRELLIQAVDSATGLMQRFSLRGDSVDWAELRAAARADVDTPHMAVPARAWYAIRRALDRLDDHHSFIMPPANLRRISPGGDRVNPAPSSRLLDGRVGYLAVPAYSGLDTASMALWAGDLQRRVSDLARHGVCGWVVDLRGNTGGNMWPMLAGVGPLLGADTVGYFVSAEGKVPWGYHGGQAWVGDQTSVSLADPVTLDSIEPVAVLTDGRTASSGEAVAIAFRGGSRSRSFGAPTMGLSTGNASYSLPLGAMLFLTTVVDADRTGHTYGGALIPDVPVNPDSALDSARHWLAGGACAGGRALRPAVGKSPLAEEASSR